MNARQKLNQAYVTGALIFGALLWLVTGSWVIFIVVVLIILGLAYGDKFIRLEAQGPYTRPKVKGKRWRIVSDCGVWPVYIR